MTERQLVIPGAELVPHAEQLELMRLAHHDEGLNALDRDLRGLLASWFDEGFLEIRRITWDAPAALSVIGIAMTVPTIACLLPEGMLAAGLAVIQRRHETVEIGSYPYFRHGRFGVSVVARGRDEAALAGAESDVRALIVELGAEPLDPNE